MMVSSTWFLWLALYASTSRRLNWSVADRTHIVNLVPSSGFVGVVVPPDPPPQAVVKVKARADSAAATPRRRRLMPVGMAGRSVPRAMSSPLVVP
jgi:hypothetical protein